MYYWNFNNENNVMTVDNIQLFFFLPRQLAQMKSYYLFKSWSWHSTYNKIKYFLDVALNFHNEQ